MAAEGFKVRTAYRLARLVDDAREERSQHLGCVLRLDDNDVEKPVVHAAVRHNLNVALDHGVVCHHTGDAATVVLLVVHDDGELLDGGPWVGKRSSEVRRLPHGGLVGQCRLHELGVKACAGHESKALHMLVALLVFPGDFSEVDAGGVSHSARAGERRRLGCVANVRKEQVCRAGWKHADGYVVIAERIEKPRYRSIAA